MDLLLKLDHMDHILVLNHYLKQRAPTNTALYVLSLTQNCENTV